MRETQQLRGFGGGQQPGSLLHAICSCPGECVVREYAGLFGTEWGDGGGYRHRQCQWSFPQQVQPIQCGCQGVGAEQQCAGLTDPVQSGGAGRAEHEPQCRGQGHPERSGDAKSLHAARLYGGGGDACGCDCGQPLGYYLQRLRVHQYRPGHADHRHTEYCAGWQYFQFQNQPGRYSGQWPWSEWQQRQYPGYRGALGGAGRAG